MTFSVKATAAAVVFALAIVCQSAGAKNACETNSPVTLATALKLGTEKLTKITGESECGQDFAARLYATAKRIETEHALARRDLELVLQLDVWREALSKCRVGSWDLAYYYHGGGTMWGHGAARDCAPLEDFLAGLAKRLPFADGKGSVKAAKQIDDAIAFIKKIKPHGEDAESTEGSKAQFHAEVEQVTGYWDHLRYLIKEIPADEAKRIVAIAGDSLRWLRDDEGR